MRAAHRLLTLDGADLKGALETSARWLEQHAEALNALNVFPVPDGDTGLNMSLTLRSAADQASAASNHLAEVAAAMARGALLGARGNSGVILAQILRGMSGAIAQSSRCDGQCLAAALSAGAEAAYKALDNPVEGTILTVARAAAHGAQAAGTGDLVATLEGAHRQARAAVAETPELLPVLKRASVVDAGGEGYRVFLEGLVMYLRGDPLPETAAPVTAWADLSSLHQEDDFYGYCTEVLFQGMDIDLENVRRHVAALGTSVLVVGDSEMLKVHVHTVRPGAVLDLATELGEIVKVKVDNMQLQHWQFAQAASGSNQARREPGTGLATVISGPGLQEIFKSLGAVVIRGGQTMNPSVQEILAGIQAVPRDQVIVLPNNPNVVLAAEQAAGQAGQRLVRVVPTNNVAQGLSACLALNPEADAETNAGELLQAAERCHCIEITRAVRAASLEGLNITRGAFLALLDGRPTGTGPSVEQAVAPALGQLPARALEIATVYIGKRGTTEGAQRLADLVRQASRSEVEIHQGGQPYYDYIISLE